MSRVAKSEVAKVNVEHALYLRVHLFKRQDSPQLHNPENQAFQGILH